MVTDLLRSRARRAAGAVTGLGIYYCRDAPEIIVPINATFITVPNNAAGGWAWGNWTLVSAGLAADFTITRLLITMDISTGIDPGRIEVGCGDPPGTVPVSEAEYWLGNTITGTNFVIAGFQHFNRRVAYYSIPAGTSIYLRHATRGSIARNAYVYLQGYSVNYPGIHSLLDHQDLYVWGFETNASLTIPETSGLTCVTVAGWNYGAWIEAVASAPNRLLAYGFGVGNPNLLFVLQAGGLIQLGVGAYPNEVPIAAAGWCRGMSPMLFGHPALIEIGERVSVRCKGPINNITPGPFIYADVLT